MTYPPECPVFADGEFLLELVEDGSEDPYFMQYDDLIMVRNVGPGHVCSWRLKGLRPLTPMARDFKRLVTK